MDVSFALFYMGHVFVFNQASNRRLPLPEWQKLKIV